MILKYKTFTEEIYLVHFVNENKILRENILTITRGRTSADYVEIALYYYSNE